MKAPLADLELPSLSPFTHQPPLTLLPFDEGGLRVDRGWIKRGEDAYQHYISIAYG